MSREALGAVRERVFADEELVVRLRDADPADFTDAVVRVAAELGCELGEADVHAATAQVKQRWMMRWIL